MCIRDRRGKDRSHRQHFVTDILAAARLLKLVAHGVGQFGACLLYTSDAADERSSVDLGGRRIIKKKKYYVNNCVHALSISNMTATIER